MANRVFEIAEANCEASGVEGYKIVECKTVLGMKTKSDTINVPAKGNFKYFSTSENDIKDVIDAMVNKKYNAVMEKVR